MAQVISSSRARWYDPDSATLDRRIFSDPEIYQQELERIFGRAWNFICHESQLPEPGRFFMNYIGEDQVIAVRDRKHQIQVLLNSCPHRGNTVCRAEQGKTASFLCSYHGWNYDLDGSLIGMPGENQFYRGDFDKKAWGLGKAAQVQIYRGFVFATLDAQAPPLVDYLGWVGRLGLDMVASSGDIEVLDGVQKNRIKCNWKLAVDNLYDWYHVKVSHGSALRIGLLTEESMAPDGQMVMLGDYGHGIGGPGLSQAQLNDFVERMGNGEEPSKWYDLQAARRLDQRTRDELGPVGARSLGHPNIFPNLWVTLTRQLCLRIPRGPFETELWWFTLLPEGMPEEERRMAIFIANHMFGPAGFLEQDDGENWSHSTRGAMGNATRKRPLNYQMGHGQDTVVGDPSGQNSIETVVNEHGQRWTYQSWQDWMTADDWPSLIANHTPAPTGVV
ncbi:MAG: Rieske 2Fe-2S domain-containing protein [Proteobacteria bacterium]|nr:Rieske 2Fe-2S domain-containing protein [Pseudomonadota bacterium]